MFYLFLKRKHKEGFQQMFSPKRFLPLIHLCQKHFLHIVIFPYWHPKYAKGFCEEKKIKVGDFNLFSIIDFTSAMRIDEKMLNSL